jgi:hypothetical protein
VPEQPFRLPRRDLSTALLNLRCGGRNRLNLELVIDICDQRHWPGMDVLRARSACRSVSLTCAYSALGALPRSIRLRCVINPGRKCLEILPCRKASIRMASEWYLLVVVICQRAGCTGKSYIGQVVFGEDQLP